VTSNYHSSTASTEYHEPILIPKIPFSPEELARLIDDIEEKNLQSIIFKNNQTSEQEYVTSKLNNLNDLLVEQVKTN